MGVGDVQKPFEGYIHHLDTDDIEIAKASAPTLMSLYGPAKLYESYFVETFEQVRSLSFRHVDKPIKINDALREAKELSTGFLIPIERKRKPHYIQHFKSLFNNKS